MICAIVYAILPQSLVFPHQFVTEAIVTPLCVIFTYYFLKAKEKSTLWSAVIAGFFLGLAMFVRPPLSLVVPVLIFLTSIYLRTRRDSLRTIVTCGVATIPMALWVITFTQSTGHFGYTGGVATLGWNLRSKVFLTNDRHDLEQPPDLRDFKNYKSLYTDPGGYSITRYIGIVSHHPIFYMEDAAMALGTVMDRGNVTKLIIDYFGFSGGAEMKNLHNILLKSGWSAAVVVLLRNYDFVIILALEGIASVVTFLTVVTITMFLLLTLVRPKGVSRVLGPAAFNYLLITTALFCAVLVSSQVVDEAQGRLRNPVEGELLVAAGLLIRYRQCSVPATVDRCYPL